MKTKNSPKRLIFRLDGTVVSAISISTIVASAVLVLAAVAAAQSHSSAIPVGSGVDEPPLFSGLGPFNPSDARVTAPFMVSGTTVFQSVQTNNPSTGGDLEFRFNVPSTGDYGISASLNCPDGGSNSVYINIDAQPTDPAMIWDVPITVDFRQRTSTWRGSATGASPPEFNPKIWHLTQGEHLFVIRGREANAVIGPITIIHASSATWNLNPVSGDWSTPANWTPPTVPNGSADTASFGSSSQHNVSLSADTEVSGMIFNSGAGAYAITIPNNPVVTHLTLSGVGIINNSGSMQNFLISGYMLFSAGSTAGSSTTFTVTAGGLNFIDSSADHGNFVINGGFNVLWYNSSADHGTFVINGGQLLFDGNASAADGTFTINSGGLTIFYGGSTAARSTFTNNGGSVSGASGGSTVFWDMSVTGDATLIANGGTVSGAGGGTIYFSRESPGGNARVKIFGNGSLSVGGSELPSITIGSIEGSGNVFLGGKNLTVGNALSTSFSGFISGPGSFTKIGTGTLSFEGGAGNDHIADSVTLKIVSGSTINLNFSGDPDKVAHLLIDGVPQFPGTYGSAASGASNVVPEFSGTGQILVTAPVVVSQKTQGAGAYDIYLPGIECRSGGATNDYKLVYNFLNPVTFTSAQVTSGNGTVANATGNGTRVVTINLTGITTPQNITVTLFGVNDGNNSSNFPISMGILVGDTTGNGHVNGSDISQTKAQSGHPVTSSNFREDVTGSGTINGSDVTVVKSKSGDAILSPE